MSRNDGQEVAGEGVERTMEQCVADGDVKAVEERIEAGDAARPLGLIFDCAFQLGFYGDYYVESERFKATVNAFLADVESVCQMAELFLLNPTSDMTQYLSAHGEHIAARRYFRPLISWLARHDRATLFNHDAFVSQFKLDGLSVGECVIVASMFGSEKVLTAAIEKDLLDKSLIEKACRVAAACGNAHLLVVLRRCYEARIHAEEDVEADAIPLIWDVPYQMNGAETPLFHAVRNDRQEAAQLLLDAGVSVHATNPHFFEEHSYLQIATQQGHHAMMGLLLRNGANVHHQDWSGKTALHDAASKVGKVDKAAVKLLLAAKADPSIDDKQGRKPCVQRMPVPMAAGVPLGEKRKRAGGHGKALAKLGVMPVPSKQGRASAAEPASFVRSGVEAVKL